MNHIIHSKLDTYHPESTDFDIAKKSLHWQFVEFLLKIRLVQMTFE